MLLQGISHIHETARWLTQLDASTSLSAATNNSAAAHLPRSGTPVTIPSEAKPYALAVATREHQYARPPH
jgi:hypothetical protein